MPNEASPVPCSFGPISTVVWVEAGPMQADRAPRVALASAAAAALSEQQLSKLLDSLGLDDARIDAAGHRSGQSSGDRHSGGCCHSGGATLSAAISGPPELAARLQQLWLRSTCLPLLRRLEPAVCGVPPAPGTPTGRP